MILNSPFYFGVGREFEVLMKKQCPQKEKKYKSTGSRPHQKTGYPPAVRKGTQSIVQNVYPRPDRAHMKWLQSLICNVPIPRDHLGQLPRASLAPKQAPRPENVFFPKWLPSPSYQ